MKAVVCSCDDLTDQELVEKVIKREEPFSSYFYNKYDKLVWSIAKKNESVIGYVSKFLYELSDLHNDIWAYIIENLEKYDSSRSSLCSWIYLVSKAKIYMIKNHFNSKKNMICKHEDYSNGYHRENISSQNYMTENNFDVKSFFADKYTDNPFNFMDNSFEDRVVNNIFITDFVFSLIELIESCTDKERKIYLCKLQHKTLHQICDEANVSTSYVPIVYKKMNRKFKELYDTVAVQNYTLSNDRRRLAKYILSEKPISELPKEFNIEAETIGICRQMLELIGLIC